MGKNVRQKKDFRKLLSVEGKKIRRKLASPSLPILRPIGMPPRGVWFLTGLALLSRLLWLSPEGLWLDEVFVYFDCKMPIWHILLTMHPLHFFIGKAFLSIHDSPEMLRLPSVLWGTAAIPIIFMTLREMSGRQAAWLGAAFMACSSYLFNYSLDANYYGAVIFFSSTGLFFLTRYLSDANLMDMIFSILAFMLALGFHPFAGILGGPAVAVMVGRAVTSPRHRRTLWPFSWFREGRPVAGIFYLVLLVVSIFFFAKALPRIRSMMNILGQLIEVGATFSNIQFGHIFFLNYFRCNLTAFSFPFTFFERTVAWGAFVLFCSGVIAGLRRKPWISILALVSVLGTFVLIFNLKAERFFHMRFLSALLPIYALFLSTGAVQMVKWVGWLSPEQDGEPSATRQGRNASVGRIRDEDKPAPALLWIVLGAYTGGIALSFALGWEKNRPWSAYVGWGLYVAIFLCLALAGCIQRLRAVPGAWRRRATLGVLVPVLLANVLSIAGRMIAAHPNYKRIVEIWKKQAQAGDPVVFQNFGEWEPLRYYLPKAGLSLRNALRLNDTSGEVGVRMSQLRGLARTLSRGWLLRSWDIDLNSGIVDWANKHLPFVEFAPSSFGAGMDIRLFRLNVKDSYLNAPYGLRIQYGEHDNRHILNDGRVLYERLVDVDGASTFTVSMEAAQAGTPSTSPNDVEIYVDGRSFGSVASISASGGIFLTDKKHTLGAAFRTSAPYPSLLWNILDLPVALHFPARALTIPFHSFVVGKEYKGRPALVLTRNVGVEYWFDFPAAGLYELTIQAVHDKGAYDIRRPVWLDIALDEQFQGILPFEKGDNTWDVRSMPIRVPSSGMHALAVNLVSGALARWNLAPDEEINAVLGDISIRRHSGGAPICDQRLSAGNSGGRAPKTIPIPVFEEKQGERPLPGWVVDGKPSSIRLDDKRPLGLQGAPAVEVEVPYDSGGIILLAPLQNLRPGTHLVQAEAMLATYDLLNHSATLGIAFFGEDASRGILPGSPVIGAQEGIQRQAGPSRFSVVANPPSGARFWAPIINIYQNGTRPSSAPGYVSVGGVRIGEY